MCFSCLLTIPKTWVFVTRTKCVLTKYFCILNEAHTYQPSLKEPLARVTRGGMHGREMGIAAPGNIGSANTRRVFKVYKMKSLLVVTDPICQDL